MNNVINLAERRLAKQAKANQQEELKFDTTQQTSTDNNIQKTKEQIAEERRQHNAQVLKNYKIK